MLRLLREERRGTGGLLILYSGLFLSIMLMLTVSLIKVSTARSVAESVQHTVAMECLASSYVNNLDSEVWNGNHVFPSVNKDGQDIDPLEQFNSFMRSYKLLDENQTGDEKIYIKYDKSDNNGHPSLTLQIGGWGCAFPFSVNNTYKIYPNPAKVTIEDSYKVTI